MADQAVTNRRLKPIYDNIDGGQYKKAIQEAEKVLKKHPGMMTAKALKALALIRLERNAEALPLIEVVEEHITKEVPEENTIQAMIHCFKELFLPERIAKMYEYLCERHPQDEQHLTQLFLSYVRIRDFKQQQRVAKLLYKEFQKPPYYYWHVMSIVMQAVSDKKIGETVLLPLAEKMVNTFSSKNSFRHEGELELFVMILDGLKKWDEAVEVMDTAEEDLLQQGTVQHRIMAMLMRAGKFQPVYDRAFSMLKEELDDWAIWKFLLCAAIPVIKSSDEETAKKIVDQLTELVLNSTSKVNEGGSANQWRMAYLAKLSLITALTTEQVLSEQELDQHPLGSLLSNLKHYVGQTFSKPTCYGDILDYVRALNGDARSVLYTYFTELADSNREKFLRNALWSTVHHQRLRLSLGELESVSPHEARGLVISLFNDIAKDEEPPSELVMNYSIVITTLLWGLFRRHGDHSALVELICIMEHFVNHGPPCALVRVVLCRVYGLLGCISKVHEQCRQLDVKYIQRDTLGHLLFPLSEQYGRYKTAVIYYTSLSAFYDQNERETMECLVNAYKNGAFAQVPKLVDFSHRCTQSVYTVASDVSNRLLSAVFAVENLPNVVETLCGDADETDWANVADNRDFDLLTKLRPDKDAPEVEKIRETSMKEATDQAKLRDLLCRAVGSIGQPQTTLAEFEEKLMALELHIKQCKEALPADEEWHKELEAFTPLYFAEYLRGGHLDYIMALLDVAKAVFSLKASLDTKSLEAVENEVLKTLPATDVFDGYALKVNLYAGSHAEPFHSNGVLRDCAEALKTFMLAMVIVKLLEVLASTFFGDLLKGSSAKNKKLKVGKGLVERFDQYRASIVMAMERVQQVLLREMDCISKGTYIPSANLDQYDKDLNEIAAALTVTLREDYSDSVSDMLATIQRESHFFEGMKFAQLTLNS